ncbi:MAG: phosphoenolpyruvate carboxykinase (ATP) [Sphingobacteriaceae bacterium]|nr:phosphoenolpyruvate carboxykinase (ATP) [Sphingobacteriaceae bacterium]
MSYNAISLPDLTYLQIQPNKQVYYQLSATELVEHALKNGEGTLADSGALAVDTGKFTGRSPKDRFIVEDELTKDVVWWGDINQKFDAAKFDALYLKVADYLAQRTFYIRDAFACADPAYRLNIRVLTEMAYQNLFAHHLFLRPAITELGIVPEWTILAAPGFMAEPDLDGTLQPNFCILNFSKRIILIGGTGYTGEIKKGIFAVLNFFLPHSHNVLSMHCSVNQGKAGDTAVFFGLSGTGKTTLSADPARDLIGDDEHGWSDQSVFNFEGGCYAKCVDLSPDKEPEIYKAIKAGALLENTTYFPRTNTVDFSNIEKTENTRVAYPIEYISHAKVPSIGPAPKNIFFLTADAFGVLPPIAKLTSAQAMYHFISGYTAKVAGTETGILEPQATFSACFGKAFMPLHPTVYAHLLGEKLEKDRVKVWLVNTGWTGGSYGVGTRMKLSYTRAIITAVLNGELEHASFETDLLFGFAIPNTCGGVPATVLNPRNSWADKQAYDQKAKELAEKFHQNFILFNDFATPEMRIAGPIFKLSV